MRTVLSILLLVSAMSLPGTEPEPSFDDLLPRPPSVVPEQNGAELLDSFAGLRRPEQVVEYRFTRRALPPEYNLFIDGAQVKAFLEEQGELVAITGRILSRPRFVPGATVPKHSPTLMFRTCHALIAKAVLESRDSSLDKAWPQFSAIHRLGCESAATGNLLPWATQGTLLTMSVCEAVRDCSNTWTEAKAARMAANDFAFPGDFAPVFSGVQQHAFKEQLDHFRICRAGGAGLKPILIVRHLIEKSFAPLMDAGVEPDSLPEATGKVAAQFAKREQRIAEMMEQPPAEVLMQLKEAQATDWDAAISGLAKWHRDLRKTDCRTWASFSSSTPGPQNYLGGFALKQVEEVRPLHLRFARSYFEAMAHSRMLKVHLALMAWRMERGKLPESTDALTPEFIPSLPSDPFDGKPIRYDPESGHLWCVGSNLKDETTTFHEQPDDCVLRCRSF